MFAQGSESLADLPIGQRLGLFIEKERRAVAIGKGFGLPNSVRRSKLGEVDERFSMQADLLAAQIVRDLKAGLKPCFVSATVGTTSSNGIDPVAEIGRICREHRLWLHVDAAMCGTAALCPEFRYLHRKGTDPIGCSPAYAPVVSDFGLPSLRISPPHARAR